MQYTTIMKLLFILLMVSAFSNCSEKNALSSYTDVDSTGISKGEKFIDNDSTYYISQGGIIDHADPNTKYSIAWYFKTYGRGKTYILVSSDAKYSVNEALNIPVNSTLRGYKQSGISCISATDSLDSKTMISVGDSSCIKYLTLDGNREASTVVSAIGKNITIRKCTVMNSKNDFNADPSSSPYTILVNATNSKNLLIDSCQLKRAGADPKVNAMTQLSKGYAIIAWRTSNSVIQNNTISSTLTCGIDITGSSEVLIQKNKISDTGLNYFSTGPVADGITGYHNWISSNEDFTITDNVITGANNHGIHVSGCGLTIENNKISDYYLSGIMVDDWRSITNGGSGKSNEFSQNVVIKDNWIYGDPKSWVTVPGNSNRKIYVDRVNDGMLLDFTQNLDSLGKILPYTTANYHIPTLFGQHQ